MQVSTQVMIKGFAVNKSGTIGQFSSKTAQLDGVATHSIEIRSDHDIRHRQVCIEHRPKIEEPASFRLRLSTARHRRVGPVRHNTAAFGCYLTTMEQGLPGFGPGLPTGAAQEAYFHACPHKFSSSTG